VVKTIGNVQKDAQVRAVASGALSNGDTVIVNSDGTVSAVAGVTGGVSGETVFESAGTANFAGAFDSNSSKVVILYKDEGNSNYPTVIVGAISGTSISFGTPVVISSHITYGTYGCGAVVFDSSNNKVAIGYYGGPSALFMGVVGTVSGTSISLGSITQLVGKRPDYISGAFDSTNNKVVFAYRDNADTSDGYALVCTVSGTSISAGSNVVFDAGGGSQGIIETNTVYDTNAGKIVILYRDNNNDDCYGIVGTVSGTSISFGSKTSFADYGYRISAVFDSTNNKIAIGYQGVSGALVAVGNVSGTSISFGTSVSITSVNTQHIRLIFDTSENKPVVFYRIYPDTEIKGSYLNVSGTTVTVDTPFTASVDLGLSQGDVVYVWDSTADKTAIAFSDRSNSSYGTGGVVVIPSTNLTSDNFIGFADGAYADTQSAVINSTCSVGDVLFSAFDVANASYDSVSFTPASGISSPRNLLFSSDGTKLFINTTGGGTAELLQYNLSTAWDITTASYSSSFALTSQDTGVSVGSSFFKPDGTKYYMAGINNDVVYEYDLSTPYTVSSMSYSGNSKNISAQITGPAGIWFYSNGTKLILGGTNTDALYQYTLSTAWDISTASYDSVSFSVSGQSSAPYTLHFNSDGTKLFLLGGNNKEIYQYSASTPYDISSLSYDNVSFSVITEANTPRGMAFKDDGSKMYILQNPNDTVYQYSTQQSLTTGQKYYVQSDGTLSTTAGDPTVEAGTAISPTKILVKG